MKKVYALYGSTGIIKIFSNKNKAENTANEWNNSSNSNNYYVESYDIE
jgi:hypothetical protein